MSMGIVTNEEFEKELNRGGSKPVKVPEVIPSGTVIDPPPTRGRKNGDTNVPVEIRKEIAETSLMDGRAAALELASKFGISASSVSAYAKGATSTASYNEPDKDIVSHLNKAKLKATRRASKTLNQALNAISQEKLDYSDAKDLAGIAKDMSAIIKNLEPQREPGGEDEKTPQFVIFAPQFRDERSYETIEVKDR